MVEKDPSQRLRTLDEAADALERVNARLATTQSFVVSGAVKPDKRRRAPAAAALLMTAALVLLGLIAGDWWPGSNGWRGLANRILRFETGHVPGRSSAAPAIVSTATGIMLLVPEGEFLMDDDTFPNEGTAHGVKLPSYYIDRLEISNRSYREFCIRTGRTAPAPPSWDPAYLIKDDYPVVNIGRDDAAAYCESAGQRLLSEQEWEKAARGSDGFKVLWGNWTLPGLANLKGAGPERPSAGGAFAADVSSFGVFDLAGNVQEWVAGEYKSGEGIVRGGSFRTPAQQLSPSWREPVPLEAGNSRLESVGFRCGADAAVAAAAKNRGK
jgi:formylglycine-generating enzyme required for sulfatase activity